MKKFFYTLAAMFCLLWVLGGCDNFTVPEDGKNTILPVEEDDIDEYVENTALSARDFIFEAPGLSVNAALTGAEAAVLRIPDEDGPWTVELEDVEDNGLFTIEDVESEDESGEEGYVVKRIVIKEGLEGTLGWGTYTIYLKISNEAGTTFYKTLPVAVSHTPTKFSKAPVVYSHITGKEKNKLTVNWAPSSGADGYNVYVGTDPVTRPGTPYNMDTIASSTQTYQITDLADDGCDSGLPNDTTYYVWVEAYNGSGSTFSPSAKRRTFDTVDPYFYNEIDWWDSGADHYQFFYNEDTGKIYIGYCTVGNEIIEGLPSGMWEVVYHQSFDPVQMHIDVPHTTYGHYTTGEDLTLDENGEASKGGVFIVKIPPVKSGATKGYEYWGTYYWGHRTIQTSDKYVSKPERSLPKKQVTGLVHTYFSNAWATTPGPATLKYGGYTPTIEAAMDTYTYEHFKYLIAFVAIPWYPVWLTSDGTTHDPENGSPAWKDIVKSEE